MQVYRICHQLVPTYCVKSSKNAAQRALYLKTKILMVGLCISYINIMMDSKTMPDSGNYFVPLIC
ncbi:hypothetical protein Hanom_Chr06g00579671 [Helianthus anomalus]